jgi:hypothetical protein
MNEDRRNEAEFVEGVVASAIVPKIGKGLKNRFLVEAFRNGELLWSEEFTNLVVTQGLNDSLDKHLKGSGYTAAWYVGLINNSPTPTLAAGDTAASHSGWSELTSYDEANRQTLTLGSVSGGSVDNSASKAVFTISATVAIYGAFVISNNTKGGTSGVLYGEGAFSQVRNLVDNDVLNVTVTLTASAS